MKPELHDVQGLVARGYGTLPAARFLLMGLEDRPSARAWAGSLADAVSPGDERPQDRALNVAFSSTGLQRLGLAPEIIALFSHEFVEGMAAPDRGRILGDLDRDAPEQWDWGGPAQPVDAVLLLYAKGAQGLDALEAEQTRSLGTGARIVRKLETSDLQGSEPFGFRDGISQPFVEGLSKAGPPAPY